MLPSDSVYHIIAKQKKDAQAGLLYSDLLQTQNRFRIRDTVIGADPSGTQIVFPEVLLSCTDQFIEFILLKLLSRGNVRLPKKFDGGIADRCPAGGLRAIWTLPMWA